MKKYVFIPITNTFDEKEVVKTIRSVNKKVKTFFKKNKSKREMIDQLSFTFIVNKSMLPFVINNKKINETFAVFDNALFDANNVLKNNLLPILYDSIIPDLTHLFTSKYINNYNVQLIATDDIKDKILKLLDKNITPVVCFEKPDFKLISDLLTANLNVPMHSWLLMVNNFENDIEDQIKALQAKLKNPLIRFGLFIDENLDQNHLKISNYIFLKNEEKINEFVDNLLKNV
ncbi:Uncharacterised protein [Mycoplasmopsis californica]|uniref:Uncharacterized protein n=1 Tax=Mycoplasmopsis equigenitalium TaxID=114883 RepID=A0ABY5J0L3_9BACT|nr:hypothetical protein [Mycoplasmopsis equigenitalium]UUD36800.1 hypothetical protein NPA09_02785 [Mycoplasmopsis equigenitalium]VEU69902.1 Uncharacterised protein [Mycoplasmopsis californica]